MSDELENKDSQYWADQIKVLEGLEPVRQRPWMYIWSTDTRWLHHMVYEIVDNAVDESMAWFCKNITVVMDAEGYITVYDDGRWIPVEKHPKTWKSTLETVLTVLHAWGKFEKSVYKVSGWLHWVGASVVNALSEHLVATVHRDGKVHSQEFVRWIPQWDIQVIWETDTVWTIIKFKADPQMFETTTYSYETLVARFKQSAYLTPWVIFTIINEITGERERFYYEGWIKTWLTNMVWDQEKLSPVLYINQEGKDVLVEVSFQFVNTNNDNIMSFVNNIYTVDGWTHVTGFKNALLKIVNEIAETKGKVDKKVGEFQISDIIDWLYTIVSVKIPEPQFEWQTKGKLWNSYVRKEVEEVIYTYLKEFFAQNEEIMNTVMEKVSLTARARLAAKLAKETVLRKNALIWWVLPWKLSDCSTKWRHWTEMFIVEGNSAWGSAKQGRDSKFQAILPLKGKILNTEQVALQKILANAEVKSLIMAIWAWIKDSYDEEKLRYDKVVIMTDADVDGAHIRTLLLTFFFRYMRWLIDNWHLYIAVPPIYKITQGKTQQYIYPPENDLQAAITKYGFDAGKTEVQRYKGLWEMNPQQLWETTMDPETRKMLQVSIQDAEDADRLFRILMGEDVMSRKHFILTHAKNVSELDL